MLHRAFKMHHNQFQLAEGELFACLIIKLKYFSSSNQTSIL